MRKFVERHRPGVVAGVLGVITLVIMAAYYRHHPADAEPGGLALRALSLAVEYPQRLERERTENEENRAAMRRLLDESYRALRVIAEPTIETARQMLTLARGYEVLGDRKRARDAAVQALGWLREHFPNAASEIEAAEVLLRQLSARSPA